MSDAAAILLLVALQQCVLALAWIVAARLLPPLRVAAVHWAGFGLLSAIALALYVGITPWPEPSRVAANLIFVAAMLLLQRGLRLFIGRSAGDAPASAALLAAVAISVASLVVPTLAPWRAATVALLVVAINAASVVEVVRYARAQLSWAWSLAVAMPMLVGAAVFLVRGIAAVATRFGTAAASGLSVSFGFALATMLVSLLFQLTLVGVAASRLSGDLRRAARHDALTGLLNRRAGEELLADEVHRARRLHDSFALVMVDLDLFKQLNDRHGHAAGDRALQHVATLLGAQVREIDRPVRWGGEEFVIVLPGTSHGDACALAHRLCDRVRGLPPVWRDQPLPITASFGVASWGGDGDSATQLLARADAALYAAKRAGRDRVAAG